jgi:diacylglycerol O-acyltransferase / wax synthase
MSFAKQLAAIELAPRDAANIYLESDRAPANIVTTAIVDGADLRVDKEAAVTWMTERLDCSPIFRRKLRRAWGDITYPSWVEDPDLTVADHVTVTHASDRAEADAVISRLLERRMDLTRPPWDLTVIDGVRGLGDGLPGTAAILAFRFHHSIGDGVVTAATYRRMLTAVPEPAADPIPRRTHGPIREALRVPEDFAKYLGALLRAPRLARAAARVDVARAATPVPTRFNRRIEGHPALGVINFDLDEIRGIQRSVPGATVNDVLLTVIAGALGRLLADLDEPTDRPLSAAMPIAVDDLADTGNSFALGTVDLHVNESDPITRLRLVHAAASTEKRRQAHPVMARLRAVPSSIPAYVTRITGERARKANRLHAGPVTMVSNVPSRLHDATFMGVPVADRVSYLTIADGATLAHFVSSAGQRVSLTVTVDSAVLPEPATYENMLRESYTELLDATGKVLDRA